MKTVEGLLKQEPIFLGWHDKEELIRDYGEVEEYEGEKKIKPEEANILFASYDGDELGHGADYVLFERDGKLYETSGSHCSCYGIEWIPGKVDIKELKHRLLEGSFGENAGFKEELCAFLGIPYKQNRTA